MKFYLIYKNHGLYDPVLDDYDPIYEPERPDSDLRSEPTEVTFENEITLDTLNDYLDSGVLTDRSLTEFPFVPNTKPYRPFSTEPLDVPPLDDPIILNPNFKDELSTEEKKNEVLSPEEDDLLKLLPLYNNVEAKFKLPVSEKYDPNWCKRVNEMLTRIERGEFVTEKVTEVVSKEVKQLENVETTNKVSNDTVMFEESKVRKEVVFNENTRKEIDIMNIEKTAQTIVDESIERAVSVTEEIKKEFEVEMRELHKESTSEEKEELSLVSERNEVNEFVHTENRTTQEIQEVINVIDSEEITNEQLMQDEEFVEDRRMSTKKEMEEMIEAGNIKRKSSAYEKTDASLERNEEKVYNKQELEESISVRSAKSKTFNQEAIESKTEVSRKVSAKETGRELKSDENQEGKQKAFMIGLQTIPHIKGFVQSSYHFDLLLRTFFVHLTDVMVALSRFILTQPSKELEGTAERVIKEKLIKDLNQERREEYRQEKTVMKDELGQNTTSQVKDISRKVKKGGMQVNHEVTETKSQEFVNKNSINKEDRSIKQLKSNVESQESFKEEERKRKSGAEMALMSERKSKDLAQRMEAVITEFETKTGQERLEVNERRRSRSRSQIEEEVMKENDPLEWLDKVNKQVSQETDIVVKKEEKKRENFSSITESKSKTESKRESRQKSTKAGKQTYIAIVESHVYTNQDAILEDQALEMSETASVQSAEDIQAALESLETVSSERVAFNDVSIKKEQAVEVISKAIEEVVQEKQEALESVTNFESSNVVEQSKSVQKESLIKAALESIYTSNESKQESFESSEELNVSKIATKQAVTKQELLANVAAEIVVAVTDSNVEKFEAKELNERKAIVKAEESYKTAAVEFEEVTLEATNEVTIESKSSKQAISKQELLATVAAESTEVITNSMLESFKTHETVTENATILSEDTFKTAAVESTELTLESAKEISELKMDVEQVTIKDTEQLETAEITETKTKICKKPAEDECASLKIIKHELIDGESTEFSQISEEFVKKSLEISTSFQSHENVSIQESHTQISSEENFNKSEMSSFQGSSVKLQVRTDLSTNDENNNTPSPSTVPPTPLTDEYVFKLVIPLPKNCDTIPLNQEETLNQEEKTLEAHEDPNIVKKKLVPHIETKIEEQIIYDPPLPTPTEDKVTSPVYCKPGLKGGAEPVFRKEYIREIERKSSLLASAIDQTIKSIEEYKEEVGIESKEVTIEEKKTKETLTNGYSSSEKLKTSQVTGKEAAELKQEETKTGERDENVLPGFKPVIFNPEAYQANLYEEVIKGTNDLVIKQEPKVYVNESGEPLGTVQGIVDGLEDAVVDEEVAKELGKPGITEDKIAELISGESEMLREAHVMGLTRVLTSHMNRPDDCSVDFQKIKPLVDSLKDSEVIKVLNEELKKEKEKEKKEQEKKWTTFLQKPKRPVPRAKFGFHGNGGPEPHDVEESYKVKIVKQPKPKVAPDYKPEDFDTGPLPWEQRALDEPIPSPIPPEDPILIPEFSAEFLEAVDPLPESEVPDLEDTGIPLPPPVLPTEEPEEPPPKSPELQPEVKPEVEEQPVEEEPETLHSMPGDVDQNKMAEQLVNSVKSMVDPNAPLEQQLCQMRAQLAALAQLPCVIQQSLELLTRQLSSLTQQESHQVSYEEKVEYHQVNENTQSIQEETNEEVQKEENDQESVEQLQSPKQKGRQLTAEEYDALKKEEEAMLEEQRKSEKMKKEQQEARIDQDSRQVKQRAPRVGKPKKMFGPLGPEERPLVLPGGRRWRGPKDAYNEQMIAEMMQAQSEVIQGKVLGYESDRLPYDERINFMKFEKPPVSLDHLQKSETYKMVHDIEQMPMKRVELLTPVVAESDYRERCRSATPRINTNGYP